MFNSPYWPQLECFCISVTQKRRAAFSDWDHLCHDLPQRDSPKEKGVSSACEMSISWPDRDAVALTPQDITTPEQHGKPAKERHLL